MIMLFEKKGLVGNKIKMSMETNGAIFISIDI